MKVYTHAMPYRAKADFDAYTNKAASYAYLPIATYQSTCPEEFLENCRVDKIEIGLRFYRGHASALLVQCTYDESDPLPVAEKILEGALIEPLAVEDAPAIAELAFNIACSTPSTENVPLTHTNLLILSSYVERSIEFHLKRTIGHWKDYRWDRIQWWPHLRTIPINERAIFIFSEILCRDVCILFPGTEIGHYDPVDHLCENYNPLNPNAGWWGYGRLLYLEVGKHKIPSWNPETDAMETDPAKFVDFLYFHLGERGELRIADEECDRLFPVSEGPVSFDSAIEHLRAFIEAAIPSSPD